jgi:hypothetical protein
VSVCSFVTPDGRRCVLEAPHATSHQVEELPAPPPVGMDEVQSYTDSWRSASPDERLVRSRAVTDRVRELTGYAHRSQPQDAELVRLAAEAVALDKLVAGDARERVRIAAMDPANREEPNNGQPARAMPSRFRPAAAGDGIWRSRQPGKASMRHRSGRGT